MVFEMASLVMQRTPRASLPLSLCGQDKSHIEEMQDQRHGPGAEEYPYVKDDFLSVFHRGY